MHSDLLILEVETFGVSGDQPEWVSEQDLRTI